jgi:aspartate racemase
LIPTAPVSEIVVLSRQPGKLPFINTFLLIIKKKVLSNWSVALFFIGLLKTVRKESRLPKHIGIVACSPIGAELCYRTIWSEAHERMGGYMNPEITINSVSFKEYMTHFESGNWEAVAELMLTSSKKLASMGADFAICPDNTVHEAYDLVAPHSPIPWLSILEEVRNGAIYKGYTCLGILGTEYIMTSSLYQKKLNDAGISTKTPGDKDRKKVHDIVYKELANGIVSEYQRAYFNRVIKKFKDYGADAVVLGCTEIPLVIDPSDCPLPPLDSTRMLARAALRKALSEE